MSIRKMWRIGIREAKMILHDPRAFMFFLVVPFIVTFLFGFLFINHMVLGIRVAVVDQANTQVSRYISRSFDESMRFDVEYYLESEAEAVKMIEQDKVDVILLIPKDFTYNLNRGKNTNVLIGINAVNSIINNTSIAGAMEIIQNCSVRLSAAGLIAKGATVDMAKNKIIPITGVMRPWFNSQYSYLNYFFLGVVAIALQQLMILAAATSFAKEKEQKTLPELVSCASNSVLAGLGKLLFYWVIALIIMVSVYYITFKVYAIPMRGKPGDIIALGIPFIIASLGIGMCIGLLCKNQINAMHWTMLLTYPCYLISGYAWPHSLMPDFLVKLSQVVPITHIAEHTRDIALLGHGFSYIKQDLLILSAMAVAATVIGLLLFVWQSKKKGGKATC